jgi:hypothetical protein
MLFSVISSLFQITMTKVLIRTINLQTGEPYQNIAYWTMGQSNVAGPGGFSVAYEISCSRGRPSEVLMPPVVDESLIGFNLQGSNIFRTYAFPISPQPPVSEVGNLIPSCAPSWT